MRVSDRGETAGDDGRRTGRLGIPAMKALTDLIGSTKQIHVPNQIPGRCQRNRQVSHADCSQPSGGPAGPAGGPPRALP